MRLISVSSSPAWCLADQCRLDQVAYGSASAGALGLFVGIVAGKEDEFLELGDLLPKTSTRTSVVPNSMASFSPHDFQFIELVVQNDKTRPAFCVPLLDLLYQTGLLRLDRRKLANQLFLAGRAVLQLTHLMRDHLLRNPLENIEQVECDRDAFKTRSSSSWRVIVLLLPQQAPPRSSIGKHFLQSAAPASEMIEVLDISKLMPDAEEVGDQTKTPVETDADLDRFNERFGKALEQATGGMMTLSLETQRSASRLMRFRHWWRKLRPRNRMKRQRTKLYWNRQSRA